MDNWVLYIIGALILGALAGLINARRRPVRTRPVDLQYRRNRLENNLKWLKLGADEVGRRLKKAKNCNCRAQADLLLDMVQTYIRTADLAIKELDSAALLAMENQLTANQQLLANARSFLERAEDEKCNIPEDGKLGGCRATK